MKVVIKPSNSYELVVDGVPVGSFEKTADLEGLVAFKSSRGALLAVGDKIDVNPFMLLFGDVKEGSKLGCDLVMNVVMLNEDLKGFVEAAKRERAACVGAVDLR